jgi:hypothetical protein
MTNSLEDFFNKLAGKDILQEMKDEEQAKKDAELKKLAEEKEKQEQLEALAIKEKEKQKLSESEKLFALEQLFGLPKFNEVAKKEVDKVLPSTAEAELEETLKVLSTSVEEYQKQKVSELDIDETDYKKYLQSKKPVSEDLLVQQIDKFLNDTYFPPKEEVKPVEEVIDAKYLHKKENVYEPLEPSLVDDVKSFIESKSEPQPYMKMNVGDPIKPTENYVSREDILKTLTKKAKSLKEQLDGGSISIEELTKEFTRFKQLTSLQLQSLGGGGAGDLKDLGDVDTSAQADGFALKYNATTGKYDFGEVASDLSAVDQNILPDANATRDIGSTSKQWNNGYFKNVYVSGSTLEVSNDAVLKGDIKLGENVGDSTEDTINVQGRFISSLEPLTTEVYNLGSQNKRWKELFLSGNTIDLGGSQISGDGTGVITIASTGVVLPTGSKVGTKSIAKSDASGVATRDVPLFTASGGLSTAAATFTMAATSGKGANVFTSFKKADGSTAGRVELFSF